MGRHQPQVAALAQDEKLFVLIIEAGILFKTQNEISFIRDQYCHLADHGSAIFYYWSPFVLATKNGINPLHFLPETL